MEAVHTKKKEEVEKTSHEPREFRRLKEKFHKELDDLLVECMKDYEAAETEMDKKMIITHYDTIWRNKVIHTNRAKPISMKEDAFMTMIKQIKERMRMDAILQGPVTDTALTEVGFQYLAGGFIDRMAGNRLYVSNELVVVIASDGYVSIRRSIGSTPICGSKNYMMSDLTSLMKGLHIKSITELVAHPKIYWGRQLLQGISGMIYMSVLRAPKGV